MASSLAVSILLSSAMTCSSSSTFCCSDLSNSSSMIDDIGLTPLLDLALYLVKALKYGIANLLCADLLIRQDRAYFPLQLKKQAFQDLAHLHSQEDACPCLLGYGCFFCVRRAIRRTC